MQQTPAFPPSLSQCTFGTSLTVTCIVYSGVYIFWMLLPYLNTGRAVTLKLETPALLWATPAKVPKAEDFVTMVQGAELYAWGLWSHC